MDTIWSPICSRRKLEAKSPDRLSPPVARAESASGIDELDVEAADGSLAVGKMTDTILPLVWRHCGLRREGVRR